MADYAIAGRGYLINTASGVAAPTETGSKLPSNPLLVRILGMPLGLSLASCTASSAVAASASTVIDHPTKRTRASGSISCEKVAHAAQRALLEAGS